jgi:putative transposase
MTYRENCTLPAEFLQGLCEHGLDALPQAITLLLNAAMQAEREQYLGAAPYERSPDRRDYANGYKEKAITSRVGQLQVAVPQVRNGEFYPSSLEKGLRSERALKVAIAEMYVQGVSTRRVAAVVEKLCGTEISSSTVSRAAAELDGVLESWRNRSLGCFPYVYLDARYESVRQNGKVEDAAVLIAIGVDEHGKRHVLGVSVATSEHEVHWREFLASLLQRGLTGVRLIISDNHAGLKAARRAVFGGVPWQRCQFHLQQNAQAYVTKHEMKSVVAADIRAIFAAGDSDEADRLLKRTVEKYQQTMPKLATWMEASLPEGLTVFSFPERHRRLLRTTNGVERVNKEIKRRTRVAGLFPNEASCLRLVSAILMEISEDWQTGKCYLTFEA